MKAHVDHVRSLSAHMKAHIHNVWSLFVLLDSHCDVVVCSWIFTKAKKARTEEPQEAVPGQEEKTELLINKVASLEWADRPARHQSGGGFTFDEFWLHHQGHWYDYNEWWEKDGCNSGLYWVWDEVGGWRRHRTSGDKLSATGGGWMNKMAAVLHMFKNNQQDDLNKHLSRLRNHHTTQPILTQIDAQVKAAGTAGASLVYKKYI